ncbi:MAG TPA: NTP transferase domain-containing protein [Gemmatimonadales bacterium]|nr:NTP transferase domain-containing protein [Gemmatimonadales bacterium]
MHGLILAGGEGSRLAGDGIGTPKPLVTLGGQAQLVRLAVVLRSVECTGVTAMVRQDFFTAAEAARREAGLDWLRLVACETPSSLHTLAAGLRLCPEGPVLCTMVDTVMPEPDWRRVAAAVEQDLAAGAALILVVTPYVDDEAPVWVHCNAVGEVVRLGADPVTPPCVTGGVYGLAPVVRDWADQAVAAGTSRMRRFLEGVVTRGAQVTTVAVDRIIDLDRRRDLEVARAWYDTLTDSGTPV